MKGSTALLFFPIICVIHILTASFVFHENTRIKYKTDKNNHGYFGYSILLSEEGLLVGAPKGETGIRKLSATGSVFLCPTNFKIRNPICQRLDTSSAKHKWFLSTNVKKDSWFGSSIVKLSNHRLLVTAPRRVSYVSEKRLPKGSLQGACHLLTYTNRNGLWDPFDSENGEPTFNLDGTRQEYGKDKTTYYDTFAELGFSIAVTNNNTVIVGAPGLLNFAGGLVTYGIEHNYNGTRYDLKEMPNPYYTKEFIPDEYFGYSVDSGIFESNGSILYIGGAPRAELGRGKVLIIDPYKPEDGKSMNIRVKLKGPQVGSYFGSSLCATDINNDGLDDLLVGAGTFVRKDGTLSYDQGTVFIYMAKQLDSGFTLEESGHVSGSEADGARFGTTIADLGDINGDGYRDIAIGAPWDDNGVGAVYIYVGNATGLRHEYVQRIQPADAQGFGWSISKGFDTDDNNCNDLAVGAYNSGTAYLYRCIRSISVRASIKVSHLVRLPRDGTNFTAKFCVSASEIKLWPKALLHLNGAIDFDTRDGRAKLVGDSQYNVTITPGTEKCHEQTIFVNLTADLTKPIDLKFNLTAHELMSENSTMYLKESTRLSEDSFMNTSKSVQVLRDCGDDSVCNPWLIMTLEALSNPFIPGADNKFGIRLKIVNVAETAYAIKVNLSLVSNPKRTPRECHIEDLVMTCDLPIAFLRNQNIEWAVEMEYDVKVLEKQDVVVKAELIDTFGTNNITEGKNKNLTIEIVPESNFVVSGYSEPNTTIQIFRDSLKEGANITFKHIFQVTNLGPSDKLLLLVNIWIPYKMELTGDIKGCRAKVLFYICTWSVPADTSITVPVSLQLDLGKGADFLRNWMEFSPISSIVLLTNQTNMGPSYTIYRVTSKFLIEPASVSIWLIIIPCIFLGLILLTLITWILYKRHFFTRKHYEELKYDNGYDNPKFNNDSNNGISLKDLTQLAELESSATEQDICLSDRHEPFEMNI